MLKGAYSDKYKALQRRNSDTIITSGTSVLQERTSKARELSKETNRRRRDLEQKRKQLDIKEEHRRQRVLSARREKQRDATERFQKTSSAKTKHKDLEEEKFDKGTGRNLKDGVYIIGDHAVEIKNGRRIYHSSEQQLQSPSSEQFGSASNFIPADGRYMTTEVNPLLQQYISRDSENNKTAVGPTSDHHVIGQELHNNAPGATKPPTWQSGQSQLRRHVETMLTDYQPNVGNVEITSDIPVHVTEFTNTGQLRQTDSSNKGVIDVNNAPSAPVKFTNETQELLPASYTLHINGKSRQMPLYRSVSEDNALYSDSLDITGMLESNNQQMPLKSNLKHRQCNSVHASGGRKVQRRVTFSDNVQFNDGVLHANNTAQNNNVPQSYKSKPDNMACEEPKLSTKDHAKSIIAQLSDGNTAPASNFPISAPSAALTSSSNSSASSTSTASSPLLPVNTVVSVRGSPIPSTSFGRLCYPDTIDLATSPQTNIAVISPLNTGNEVKIDTFPSEMKLPKTQATQADEVHKSVGTLNRVVSVDCSVADSLEVSDIQHTNIASSESRNSPPVDEKDVNDQKNEIYMVSRDDFVNQHEPPNQREAQARYAWRHQYIQDPNSANQTTAYGMYSTENGTVEMNVEAAPLPQATYLPSFQPAHLLNTFGSTNGSSSPTGISSHQVQFPVRPMPRSIGSTTDHSDVFHAMDDYYRSSKPSSGPSLGVTTSKPPVSQYQQGLSIKPTVHQYHQGMWINPDNYRRFVSQNDVVNNLVDTVQTESQNVWPSPATNIPKQPNPNTTVDHQMTVLPKYADSTPFAPAQTADSYFRNYGDNSTTSTINTVTQSRQGSNSYQAYHLIKQDPVVTKPPSTTAASSVRQEYAYSEPRKKPTQVKQQTTTDSIFFIPDSSDSSDDDDDVLMRARNSMAELNFNSNTPTNYSAKDEKVAQNPVPSRPSNIPRDPASPSSVFTSDEQNITAHTGKHERQKSASGIPLRVHSGGRRFTSSAKENVSQFREQSINKATHSHVPHPPRIPKESPTPSPQPVLAVNNAPMSAKTVDKRRQGTQVRPGLKSGWENGSNGKQQMLQNNQRVNSGRTRAFSSPRTTQTPVIHANDTDYTMQYPPTGDRKGNALFIPLDKTPTDDDINVLWENVRNCLHTNEQDVAYSDSAYIKTSPRKHYNTFNTTRGRGTTSNPSNRINSGSHRQPQNNHIYKQPATLPFRRYGSHENLRRQNSLDNLVGGQGNGNNNRLTQRARSGKQILNSSNNSRGNVTGPRFSSQVPRISSMASKEVSDSLASFLEAEAVCHQETLTPQQTHAVFQASQLLHQNLTTDPAYAGTRRHAPSALSVEERKAMESLERLNLRLRDQEVLTQKLITTAQKNSVVPATYHPRMQHKLPEDHRPVIMDASKRRQYTKSASTSRPVMVRGGRKANSAR